MGSFMKSCRNCGATRSKPMPEALRYLRNRVEHSGFLGKKSTMAAETGSGHNELVDRIQIEFGRMVRFDRLQS